MGTTETLAEIMQERELGNGLFASFDGDKITIESRASRWRTHTIQFTPGTLLAFERYVDHLRETFANARKTQEIADQIKVTTQLYGDHE